MKNERSIPFSQSWCSLVATDVCRNPAPKKRFLDEYESSLCYRKSAKEIIQKGLFLDIVNVQAQKRVEAVKVAAVVYFLMFGNQTPAYTKLLSLFGREYARMTDAVSAVYKDTLGRNCLSKYFTTSSDQDGQGEMAIFIIYLLASPESKLLQNQARYELLFTTFEKDANAETAATEQDTILQKYGVPLQRNLFDYTREALIATKKTDISVKDINGNVNARNWFDYESYGFSCRYDTLLSMALHDAGVSEQPALERTITKQKFTDAQKAAAKSVYFTKLDEEHHNIDGGDFFAMIDDEIIEMNAIESKTPSAEDSESTLSEEAAHTNEEETNISIVPDDIDDKLALLDSDTSEVQKQDMASVQTNDGNLLSGRNSIDDIYEDDVKATSSAIDEFSNASSEQEQAKAIAELNSQSGLDGAQHSLSKTNAIPQDSAVESITADGNQLHANAVKRDDTGTTIMSVGIAKGESGIVATGDTSTTKISPTGESVSFTNGKGTFELRQTGIDEETGNASWEAIQTKGADGSNIPEPARTTQSFQVDNVAGQNDEQAAAAATEAFSKGSNDTPSIQDTLVSNTQAATEKTRQEGVAAVQQYKAVTASTPETTQSTGSSATPTIQSITPEEKEQASVNLNTVNVRAGIQQDLADQGAIDKDEKVSSVRAEEGKVYATMTKEVDGNMVAREVEIDTNNGKLSVGKETYKARTLSDGATVVRSEAGEFYANREGDTVTVARVKDASGERVKENDGGNTFTFTHDSNKNETQEIGEKSHQIIASGAAAMETGDASGGGTAVTEHQLETMGAQTTQSQNRTPQAGVPASAKPQSQEKVKAPSATDKRHINTSSASSDWKKKQIDAHGSDTRETKKKTDSSEQ